MSETVRVPLTVEQRADKADAMAGLVKRIEGVKTEAKETAAEYREEIEGLMAELSAIANVVQDGAEPRSQMDLTFEESQRALAAVGERICACEGGPEGDVHSPSCPVHGVESRGEEPARCDGVHSQDVACQDPKCWLIEGPAEEAPSSQEVLEAAGAVDSKGNATEGFLAGAEAGPEVAADYVVPEAEHVDVEKPEEPAVVTEFHRAKAKRRHHGETTA